MNRIIALVDMDCFYVQVEQRLDPLLVGQPCAVIQYNEWQGGAIIAVNYEARAFGVSRQMRGNEAQSICPDIKLAKVPEIREKADLTRYREAGAEVIEVLKEFSDNVERASIDEAYIDLTEAVLKVLEDNPETKVTLENLQNSFVSGWDAKDSDDIDKDVKRKESLQSWLTEIYENPDDYKLDIQLAIAAKIVEEMRAAVYQKTQFRCSAGVAHNKMIAKLCCGLNKPNKQTVVPQSSVPHLFNSIPIKKVRGFGGKFGKEVMEKLDVEFMSDLSAFEESHLASLFGEKSGKWLYDVAHGLEYESVSPRFLPKSIGCSKNFLGPKTLRTKAQVKHWLLMLAQEIEERLVKDKEANKRVAKHMTVGMTTLDETNRRIAVTRSCPVTTYCATRIHQVAYDTLLKVNTAPKNSDAWTPQVINVCMSAGKFEDDIGTNTSITKFFAKSSKPSIESNADVQDRPETSSGSFFNSYLKRKIDIDPEKSESTDESCDRETSILKNSPNLNSRAKKKPRSKHGNPKHSIVDMLNRAESSKNGLSSTWHQLDVDKIDDDVLEDLPADIQLEISKYKETKISENKSETKICPQCNEETDVSKFSEHLDYHVAKKLSEDLNDVKPPLQINSSKRAKTAGKTNSKRAKNESGKISSYFK